MNIFIKGKMRGKLGKLTGFKDCDGTEIRIGHMIAVDGAGWDNLRLVVKCKKGVYIKGAKKETLNKLEVFSGYRIKCLIEKADVDRFGVDLH